MDELRELQGERRKPTGEGEGEGRGVRRSHQKTPMGASSLERTEQFFRC